MNNQNLSPLIKFANNNFVIHYRIRGIFIILLVVLGCSARQERRRKPGGPRRGIPQDERTNGPEPRSMNDTEGENIDGGSKICGQRGEKCYGRTDDIDVPEDTGDVEGPDNDRRRDHKGPRGCGPRGIWCRSGPRWCGPRGIWCRRGPRRCGPRGIWCRRRDDDEDVPVNCPTPRNMIRANGTCMFDITSKVTIGEFYAMVNFTEDVYEFEVKYYNGVFLLCCVEIEKKLPRACFNNDR